MNFKCKMCEQLFELEFQVINHYKLFHNLKEKIDEFPCVINNSCEKQYLTIRGLKGHIKKCLLSGTLRPLNPVSPNKMHDFMSTDSTLTDNVSPDFMSESIERDVMFKIQTLNIDSNYEIIHNLSALSNIKQIELGSKPGNLGNSFIDSKEYSFVTIDSSCQKYCEILHSHLSELSVLSMKHSEKDKMFKLINEIVAQTGRLSKELIQQDNGMSPLGVIDASTAFFTDSIETFQTRYKRDKRVAQSSFYVPPQQRAVGTRIEMIYDKEERIERPHLIQSTLQYISIISTLEAFFKRPENLDMYFQFQNKHRCEDGVYKHFCCSSEFKTNDFFLLNPTALQIRIALDDVELCDPLASKSSLHKICAVYFMIKNIPSRFNSKLNNIFLLAICNTDDLKTKKTDVNNIWEMVVSEIKYLEEFGITLENGQVLKATLVDLSGDNLGINTSLCLTESFRSRYYCRICTRSSDECQQATTDDLSRYRNTNHYQEMLNVIDDSEKVDLKETYGIKRYCLLNDLNHFHIFKNFNVDIMHDMCEGVISFLLNNVFLNLIKNKVLKENDLKDMIKFYQYPKNFRRDKPSILSLTRSNLGQNATQMKCLFLNFPFIFKRFEENVHLQKVWPSVKSLLRVFQIVFSESINEILLTDLEKCVSQHLQCIKELFNVNLIPKHHFMVHYANVIRKMGPLLGTCMLRPEAKHTFFKTIARNTNNFVNINKTLAISHQQKLATNENTFRDKFHHTKPKKVNIDFIRTTFDDTVLSYFLNYLETFELESLSYNSCKFERGSIILYNRHLYEIEMVLLTSNSYFFVVSKLVFLGLDEFSQSLKVNKSNSSEYSIVVFNDLSHKKAYCSKFVEKNQFIIIDNTDILSSL